MRELLLSWLIVVTSLVVLAVVCTRIAFWPIGIIGLPNEGWMWWCQCLLLMCAGLVWIAAWLYMLLIGVHGLSQMLQRFPRILTIREQWMIARLHWTIDRTVRSTFPEDWNEDFITRLLLRKLRNMLSKTTFADRKIAFGAWKFTGRRETDFGDVGILVVIAYADGTRIEGAAFLEAKKLHITRNKFDELRMPQLTRILNNMPIAKVLLYDYRSAIRIKSLNLTSCANTVPMAYAAKSSSCDEGLYKCAIPFSYQLVDRYFHGEDLAFTPEAIQVVRGFSETLRPPFLITAAIAVGGVSIPDIGEINEEVFARMENQSDSPFKRD